MRTSFGWAGKSSYDAFSSSIKAYVAGNTTRSMIKCPHFYLVHRQTDVDGQAETQTCDIIVLRYYQKAKVI